MTETTMEAKRQRVIEASQAVFVRYGYGRTTMADLARAAEMSRPALYLIYASKEELFSAMIRQMSAQSLAEIRDGLTDLKTLESQLHLAFEIWVARGFDMVERHPDASDLFDYERDAVREIHAEFEALLSEILREPVARAALPIGADELARSLRCALRGFKDEARDGAELRGNIALQVKIAVALLERPSDAN